MKKLLIVLLCLPLLFTTCKKEKEETPTFPFMGYWSGNYYQQDSTKIGPWSANISSSGVINGAAVSVESPYAVDLIGTVTNKSCF